MRLQQAAKQHEYKVADVEKHFPPLVSFLTNTISRESGYKGGAGSHHQVFHSFLDFGYRMPCTLQSQLFCFVLLLLYFYFIDRLAIDFSWLS
ncbi:hypothetical protein [Undibacterium pigrum]|uniref:hypothetical protein n=1 Tax=Undibacterium pigrum TaxID=401470 RepID=UPI0011B5E225|nr:hypothetical protein [Undibacterium pigrum]